MEENKHVEKEAVEQPSYLIEGARSSTSKCKTCRKKIAKGNLRLGVLVEGFYGPGYMWHHLECAARRQLDKVEEAYAEEAWKAAKVLPENIPDIENLRKLKEKAEKKRAERKELPYLELDPSGRARCKLCGEPIEKGSIRVALAKDVSFAGQTRTNPVVVHIGCVKKATLEEDVQTQMEGLGELLRQNSVQVEPERIEEAIALIMAASD